MTAPTASQPRKLEVFPAFHKVTGRRVVIVGQGEAAAAKLRLLAETSADLVLFAPALDAATGADLIRAGGRWVPRLPLAADLAGAALAFVATRDDATDRAIWSLARAVGVPVNVVDQPDLCDFYTPAIVNRAPLAVAIGTEGTAPVLARHLRARIEALLAPTFGDLAGLAEKLRGQVTAAIATVEGRRRFWAGFFTGPIAEKVFAGRIVEAESEAFDALRRGEGTAGHVSLVGAGPGASDLLTLRAQRILQEADIIIYDRLVPDKVVAMGRRDAERVYVGKAKGAHAVTQGQINALLVRHAKAGKRVVRLKSGDPLIFGRAGEEIAALRQARVSFDVVPGVTAAFAAAAEAEIPLTLRGVSSALVFATGLDADGEILPEWEGLALKGTTVAVYMGHAVAGKVAARLIEAGMVASTPVAVIENASRADMRAFAGRLDGLHRIVARPEISGPVLIIIGNVVAESALLAAPAPRGARSRPREEPTMFRAASAGPAKVITANRLGDGLVVFLDDAGGWPLEIAKARLLADGPELDGALAYGKAQHDARVIVEPYAIDVEVKDGVPEPVRLRERIRAEGPTVDYGDAERARLGTAG